MAGSSTTLAVTNLVFSDEFSGSSSNVDLTKWSFDLGNTSTIAGDGWGTDEKDFYTNRLNNVFVANGLLHIIMLNDLGGATPYSSARLHTFTKFSMTYGRVEFRVKLPGHGFYWWPACWMLATNFSNGANGINNTWPRCGEIDVMETVGYAPYQILGTLHKDSSGSPGLDDADGGAFNFPFGDGTTNFHTYVVSWASNLISFAVDNNTPYFSRVPADWSSSTGPSPSPFNHPYYLIMNLAVGGGIFGGSGPDVATINATDTFPAEMDVDYVRVYQDIPAISLTSVSPSSGCQSGGTTITISGSNFLSTATVTVGGVPATGVVIVNSNTMTAVTPPNTAGAKDVAVTMQYISPPGTNVLTRLRPNAFTYAGPPAFAGLAGVTAATGGATLSWAAASGVAPITYKVFEATTGGAENFASPALTTNSLSVFITPLDPGNNCTNTYFFVVRAMNGCGNSESNSVELSVQPTGPAPTFGGFSGVTASINAATLSWSAASGGTPPYTYKVFQATASGTENFAAPLLSTNDLSISIPLYPGSNSPITYFFVVRAQGGCGTETNTVEQSIQPLLDPNGDQTGNGIPNIWLQQYGFSPFDAAAAATDSDGDGMSNLQEFLSGTDPTNSASFLHILSVAPQDEDLLITWAGTGGFTNVVQATFDLSDGYSNISDYIMLSGAGDSVTNYLDSGAATNGSPRFYRIGLVP